MNSQKTEEFDVDWKNPPKVTDLKTDYDSAQSAHIAQRNNLERWRQLTKADDIKAGSGRSKIQPKLIRKQAEWRYASLSEPFLSTYNLIEASPVTYEDKQAADQNQLVLNYQLNCKINKVRFIDDYVRAAVDEGTVVLKTGWEYREDVREVEVPIYGLVPVQDPQLAQEMMAQGLQPLEEAIVEYKLEEQMITVCNHPTVEICELDNVVIDPTCEGDISKANFVIHSYETSINILKEDGRYKNLDNINLNEGTIYSQPDHSTSNSSAFEFKDKARKKVIVNEYWGYWDVNGDGTVVPILAAYIGNTLIRLEDNPFPDKELPFVVVHYLPKRKAIYGEPDAELLEDNQKIIGAVTRGMIDLMGRSANAQQGIRKDALDVANKRKFEDGKDYMFNANVDPRQAIYMHTYPEIPNSALTVLQMQNNEAESITGVKAFHSGITGNSLGATATGIRSAMDATSKREIGILRRLSDGIIKVARKFMAMNAVFLEEEEVIRITNDEFVRVDRKDLQGQIDLKLTISTAETDNEKASELAFMLQTLGNTVPVEITMGLMAEIAKLRKMPDLAKKLEDYEPQPDPVAQERAMLEIELLKAQIANEYAKAQENQVDALVKQEKGSVESAKARKLNSEADIKDLDFLDRQLGTDVEKQQAIDTNKTRNKIDEDAAKALLEYQKNQVANIN